MRATFPLPNPAVRFLGPSTATPTALPLPTLAFRVACGFPSPAEDFQTDGLDLSERCISNPVATFFAVAEGNSMEGFGISHGDTLIIDRSIEAKDGDIALVLWDDGLAVKKLRIRRNAVELHSGHPAYPPILVGEGVELQVWGVITWSFRQHFRRKGAR